MSQPFPFRPDEIELEISTEDARKVIASFKKGITTGLALIMLLPWLGSALKNHDNPFHLSPQSINDMNALIVLSFGAAMLIMTPFIVRDYLKPIEYKKAPHKPKRRPSQPSNDL